MFKIIVAIFAALAGASKPAAPHGYYDAWTSTGIHVFVDDNGTPEDFSDDWVFDWEDNRVFTITVID